MAKTRNPILFCSVLRDVTAAPYQRAPSVCAMNARIAARIPGIQMQMTQGPVHQITAFQNRAEPSVECALINLRPPVFEDVRRSLRLIYMQVPLYIFHRHL